MAPSFEQACIASDSGDGVALLLAVVKGNGIGAQKFFLAASTKYASVYVYINALKSALTYQAGMRPVA